MTTRSTTSSTAQDAARAILAGGYGLDADVSPLAGENRNFLVTVRTSGVDPGVDTRGRYVLKIASEDRPREILELEHAAVEHLARAGVALAIPRTVLTTTGAVEASVRGPSGDALRGRLITYVAGTPWCELPTPQAPLLRDLGRAVAAVGVALQTFTHPAARRTHQWNLADQAVVSAHRASVALIDSAPKRLLADAMFQMWAACAAPRLATLPHSFIYGDANDENVLVTDGRVTGLLDFGDALFNPTVCDLAIALTYAMLDRDDPLAAAAEIIAGYTEVRALEPAEVEVLFALVCGRLATSVTIAAERWRLDPNRANWFVTEDRAWRLIGQLAGAEPTAVLGAWAAAAGAEVRSDVGAPIERVIAQRRRHIGPSLSVAYDEPLEIVRGAGQYLFDQRGRPYLDLVNNVCHVGHCHPRVVAAGQRQMARLNTNTRYLHEALTEYAARLTATLPPPLEVCYFVNSGSEANELAVRLARAHTRRRDVVVIDGAYHGNTNTLIALSPYKFKGPGGTGAPESWVHVAPIPDGYRGPYKGHDRKTGEAYGDAVGQAISKAGAPIAALLVESLMSCAGQVVPPPGYLETAFRHVRAAGGVCIVDEVQTGFGRVGSHFWGFELQGVVPDIVVMGKPIGNGHPIGAVVTTREMAASFDNGMEYFSTFGGNPVSCAIGLAVLDVIRDEGLQAHASRVGGRLIEGLRGLASRHLPIGDVRGEGLFIGVELVRNRQTLEPATSEASALINRLKAGGVLLSTDGPYHNVLKIKPPLVLTEDDADMVVQLLDDDLGSEWRTTGQG